jgi:hypothetical protein
VLDAQVPEKEKTMQWFPHPAVPATPETRARWHGAVLLDDGKTLLCVNGASVDGAEDTAFGRLRSFAWPVVGAPRADGKGLVFLKLSDFSKTVNVLWEVPQV